MESLDVLSGGIVGILIILIGFIMGIPLIAFGQLISVFREIALNTRRENDQSKNQYKILESLAILTSISGWVAIVGGFLLGSWTMLK